MRLASICTSVPLMQEIESCVRGVTRAKVEASRLVNLFVLHLLHTNTVIPKLDQTFFYRAFGAVTGRGPAALHFEAVLGQYMAFRPEEMPRFDSRYVPLLSLVYPVLHYVLVQL